MHIHAPLKLAYSGKKCWRCRVRRVTKDASIHYGVCKGCYKALCEEQNAEDAKLWKINDRHRKKEWRKKWVKQIKTEERQPIDLFGNAKPSQIKYPRKTPEAEIQALIFGLLFHKGHDAHLEVCEAACRFDVVVFDDDKKAVIIVETKRSRELVDWEQLSRYRKTGVPVISISDLGEAVYFCKWFSKWFRER